MHVKVKALEKSKIDEGKSSRQQSSKNHCRKIHAHTPNITRHRKNKSDNHKIIIKKHFICDALRYHYMHMGANSANIA